MKLMRDFYYCREAIAVCLVTIGGLETTTNATKVLRVNTEEGFYNNTLQNALRDVRWRTCEKIPKPCLLHENVLEKLYFATIHKH